MSINILTNYNFNGNQIISAVVDNRLRTAVSNPRTGQIVFDSDSKRLYYWTGTVWEGSDAIDAMSKLNGTGLVDYINSPTTSTRINNNRLGNSSITLGTTIFNLGDTKTNIQGLTLNGIEFTKLPTGFSITGGDTKKTLTLNDNLISNTNSLTLGSGKIATLYSNTTIGSSGAKGDITIKSNGNEARVLTLTNPSLEIAGDGTKLTINGTPTIAGGGTITVPTSSKVIIQGNNTTERTLTLGGSVILNGASSATLNAPFTVGETSTNTGNVTLRSSSSASTTITSTGAVNLVAGTMVNTVDARLHMQNTDTGTSNPTFQINTAKGVILQSANMTTNNLELQLRNPENLDYASIRVKNLYVEGTTTSINSNTISIGDNEIDLNSDVSKEAENGASGGIAIKRYSGAVIKPARLTYTEATGKWGTTNINDGVEVVRQLTNKHVATFGDGEAHDFTITHNLNTRDVAVTIRETGSPYGLIFADVDFSQPNSIRIITSTNNTPASNQYTVTIVG